MFDVLRLAFFAIVGSGIGVVAFSCFNGPPSPAQPTPAAVTAAPRAEPEPPETPEDVDEPEAVTVTMTPSRAFGSDRRVYAHFVLAPTDERVGQVRLHVKPGSGVSVEDVFGRDWERHPDGVTVDVGDLEASEHVVVELQQRAEDAGSVLTNVSHRARGGTGPLVTSTDPVARNVTSTSPEPAVEVFVSQAMTNRALDRAGQLRDDRSFQEAIDTLEHARGWNAEIGLALRVAGELKSEQSRLRSLRDDIKREMNRPRRRRTREQPGITILYGDGS